MITSDGYTLTYEQKANRIVICLPQTFTTLSNTVSMISNRKLYLTPEEETAILSVVKTIMEVKHG